MFAGNTHRGSSDSSDSSGSEREGGADAKSDAEEEPPAPSILNRFQPQMAEGAKEKLKWLNR